MKNAWDKIEQAFISTSENDRKYLGRIKNFPAMIILDYEKFNLKINIQMS